MECQSLNGLEIVESLSDAELNATLKSFDFP